MPVYVYRCSNCDHQFEQQQSFSDDALTVCPTCHEAALRKVFNSVGIVFKGSGFYRTDSRSGSSTATVSKSEKSDTSSSGSDTKSATKTEKPAPKTESKAASTTKSDAKA